MKRHVARKVAVGATIAVVAPVYTSSLARAQTTTTYWYINSANDGSGDLFGNFDNTSTSLPGNGAHTVTNVDWPVTFIYYNNAEIDKVKAGIKAGNPTLPWTSSVSVEYAVQKDGASLGWDSDRGEKDPSGSCSAGNGPDDVHMRFYADPSDDRMGWSSQWGYWIFATDHKDLNEGCASPTFGYSEQAEGSFVGFAVNAGYWTVDNSLGISNAMNEWQGNYFEQSDGWAAASSVP